LIYSFGGIVSFKSSAIEAMKRQLFEQWLQTKN
jgi:hypothetical protein